MPFNNPIVGGTVLVRPAINSPNFVAGSAGWAINADGSAQFNGPVTITNGSLTVTLSDGSVVVISPANQGINYTAATVNSLVLLAKVLGDIGIRFDITATGILQWGDGTNPVDTDLFRNGTKKLATHGELDFVNASAAGNTVIGATVVGDTVNRLTVQADGSLHWGSGSAAQDTNLYRFLDTGANPRATSDQGFLARVASGNDGIRVARQGDNNESLFIMDRGQLRWSDGTNSSDTHLYRAAAGVLAADPIKFNNAGVAEAWTGMTLLNGFANRGAGFPNASYRRVPSPANTVQIKGQVTAGGASGTVMATLPVGFRPVTEQPFWAYNNSTNTPLLGTVGTGGNVTLFGSSLAAGNICQFAGDPALDL